MDEKSLHILEYDKIRERLAGYTSFSAGEALAHALHPTSDLETARRWQAETAEAVLLLDSQRELSTGGARDVRRAADSALRGFTLQPAEFLEIRNTLEAAEKLRRQLLKTRSTNPQLASIADLIESCPGLGAAIDATLDERGEVLDSASVTLANLRKALRVAYARIQDKLQRLVNSDQGQFLQEPIITMRSGRYVIPLRADARGRLPGIVHDQSSSGATLWVEPMNTVELNNEYRGLQAQEQKEVARILAALSAQVAEQAEPLQRIVERMAELDLILAKARYATVTRAVEPVFVEWRSFPPPRPPKHASERRKWTPPPPNPHPGSTIWIKGARHPLLDPEQVVPTDWTVDEQTFLVLITGPNTGGKTVSLKTLGLMVLMAQAGLHLPAVEARLTLFEDVFADIGDEQSIEQSLSTFSGHITNISRILRQVNERSLVLLDELGSGTDPGEGAALAQAIISFLRDKGVTTFVATHFPELKLYASQTPGATNASLLFDVDTLSPTFELSIGLPGRSNALVIARRLGLEESILDEAMRLVGAGTSEAGALLDTIHELRERISSQEAASRVALRQAEGDRAALAARLAAVDEERAQILQAARAQAEEELEGVRAEIRRVRRQLKDAQSRTALKRLGQELEAAVEEQREADVPAPAPARSAPVRDGFAPGDTVLVKSLRATGQVLSVSRDEVEVAVGRLYMRARFEDLALKERAEEEVETEVPASTGRRAAPSPGMELDLRGQRVEDGLRELERYLEQAYLANLPWTRIIHGKGTGRLREAVRQVLGQHRYVSSWEEGKDGEGGAGVTVARLRE